MGVFKSMKEMKSMINTAPGQIRGATELAANAKIMAEASAANAATITAMPAPAAGTAGNMAADLTPIAGVDIASYGWVTKQIAALGYDQNLLAGFAAQRGIDATSWQLASVGWAARMTNATVATEFRRYYDAS